MSGSVPQRALPKHVAIIMDGNGRWAKERDLPRVSGHQEGAESVRAVTREARKLGVSALTLYAFSAQNWGRPPEEIKALMELLTEYVTNERQELMDNQVRLRTIGDISRLPDSVKGPLGKLVEDTAGNTGMTLTLALSYDSKQTIVDAACAALQASGEITQSTLASHLETASLPPLDLLIRTSGEQRISNFLLWESAYAELMFVDTLWPDFRESDFQKALQDYAQRERRFGLTSEQLIQPLDD